MISPKLLASLLIFTVRIYQAVVSPLIHMIAGPSAGCRFQPTCSEYAVEVLHHHPLKSGIGKILGRIFKCHPWSRGGLDPVVRR